MQTGTHGDGGTSPKRSPFPTSEEMAEQAHETTDRWADKASSRAQHLADKVHEGAQRVSDSAQRLSDKVQPTIDALSAKASHAVDAVGEKAEHLRGMQESALAGTRNYVRENPIAAIGIAAVVGLLIGRMRH